MADETLVQHTIRVTKNAFTGCLGSVKKSDELAKIKYKESQIAGRKKQFGVEYLDLLAAKAEPSDLEACVKKAQDDMKKIQDEIVELEKEVERVNEETEKKIREAPVKAPAKDEAKDEVKEEAKTNTSEPTAAPAPAKETPPAPSAPAEETTSA